MSNQIILSTDPLSGANPFFGSANVTSFCLNASQWTAQQKAFEQVAFQLGYFCLVVGAVIGFIAGYIYVKRRYGDV
jgi:hypothetical protein